MINELLDILKYAPKAPATAPADGLVAWRLPEDAGFVCAHCAGRIFARGCRLPQGVTAVWSDTVEAPIVCALQEGH